MSIKVLMVDDERDVCEVVKETLEYEGFEVTTENFGDAAIRCLNGGTYQFLLVDMRLEGSVSGIDVIKHCRTIADRPKIFVVSGSTRSLLAPVLEEAGIADLVAKILEKPSDLSPDRIVEKLKSSL